MIKVKCCLCGKMFEAHPSSKRKYCSLGCSRVAQPQNNKARNNISREVLEELFLKKNMSREDVCKTLNISKDVFKARIKEFGLAKPRAQINQLLKGGKGTSGWHYYHNGDIEMMARACPDGFLPGRSNKARAEIGKINRGRSMPTEQRAKVSASKKGHKYGPEFGQKLKDYWKTHKHPLKGRVVSEEEKQNLREKRKQQVIASPVKDALNILKTKNLEEYLNVDLTIDYNKVFRDINLEDLYSRKNRVRDIFKERGVRFIDNTHKEDMMYAYISGLTTHNITRSTRTIIPGYELDLYIPALKLAIEFNGVYWHRTEFECVDGKYSESIRYKIHSNYHFKKSKTAYDAGIRLIHIWEDQWEDPRLRPIIEGIIKGALKVSAPEDQRPIYARKCIIKEVPVGEYTQFCNRHHTQLSRPASVRYGLYFNDELVQVASFNKFNSRNGVKTKHVSYDWEWVRGCEDFNHSVVIGGVSKLFRRFIKDHNPESVLCYSDFNFFNGTGYGSCGFELDGFTGKDKFYVTKQQPYKRINRSATKYKEYMQNVVDGKWVCCFGAGSMRWVWRRPESPTQTSD